LPTGLSVIQFTDLYKGDFVMDWDSATATDFKAALYGALTINFSTITNRGAAPFTSGEQSGSGYAAGGMSVPGRSVSEVGSTGVIQFVCTYLEWNPITTVTVRNVVIYKTTASNKIIGVWDLGTPADVTGGVFRITFASNQMVTHKVIP
jgi:hypothetical protein